MKEKGGKNFLGRESAGFFFYLLGGSLQRWVAQIPSFGIVEVDQFFLPLLFEEVKRRFLIIRLLA